MARDRLPPIEFEAVDDGPSSSSSAPEPVAEHAGQPRRWVIAGVLVVLGVVAATAVLRLSDERDEAKAEAARAFDERDSAKAEAAHVHEALALGLLPLPARLLDHSGALFSLPSSPSLREGAIGVVITSAVDAQNYTWILVDGRGAVAGDTYLLEGGRCDGDSAVPSGNGLGSVASTASGADGDLRLVAGPLTIRIDDADFWAELRHNGEDLGGVRGPLAHPTWVAPGANPCDPSNAG